MAVPALVLILGVLAAAGLLEQAVRANRSVFESVRPVYWSILSNYHKRISDPGQIDEYLRTASIKKLQLGAGDLDAKGWLNTDFEPNKGQVFLDVTERFPFPDASFQFVFSEHLVEHVPYEGGLNMMKECFRILAPGGRIRTVTPNLSRFVSLLDEGGRGEDAQRFIDAKLRFHNWPVTPFPATYILNRQVRDWGHQFLYDPASLRRLLEQAGFSKIREFRPGEVSSPVFHEAEGRTKMPGSDLWQINNWEAMAIEAER